MSQYDWLAGLRCQAHSRGATPHYRRPANRLPAVMHTEVTHDAASGIVPPPLLIGTPGEERATPHESEDQDEQEEDRRPDDDREQHPLAFGHFGTHAIRLGRVPPRGHTRPGAPTSITDDGARSCSRFVTSCAIRIVLLRCANAQGTQCSPSRSFLRPLRARRTGSSPRGG